MPRQATPLTEVTIRHAITKGYTSLWDGGGLHLLSRNGGNFWRMKYRRPGSGKENRIALGVYPQMPLRAARAAAQDVHTLLRRGIDPAAPRAAQRAEERRKVDATFERVGDKWLAMKSPGWSKSTVDKTKLVLHGYLNPAIGNRDVATITSADVVKVLRAMAARVPDLAVKAAGAARSIIRYAIAEEMREEGKLLDLDLRNNLPKREKGHLPAATTPKDVAHVMKVVRAIESEVTRAALLVCAYTAQRPGNIAAMRWADVDLENAEWIIPGPSMKMRNEHVVPLSAQAVALIESMKGRDKTFVFPPISEQKTPHLHRDSLSKALRDAGLRGKQTPHGLRATLRTVARERLGISADVLEAQLAHVKKGDTQAAYDRAQFLQERHELAKTWADYLDGTLPDNVTARKRA